MSQKQVGVARLGLMSGYWYCTLKQDFSDVNFSDFLRISIKDAAGF